MKAQGLFYWERITFMVRVNYSSGAPLEELVGYSRMVQINQHLYIGGTTAVMEDGSVFGITAFEQADYIFQKFIGLLKKAGADETSVFKIKAYVIDMNMAKEVGEAFSIYFKQVKPLFTMVETPKLNRPTQLVEIELEAIINKE